MKKSYKIYITLRHPALDTPDCCSRTQGLGLQLSRFNTFTSSSFNTYLGSPCSSIFTFEYTNPDKISKHIQSLRPKSRPGHDGISSKLLKELVNIISPTLSVIINQSLCTGIFPGRLKIGKVLPLFKKVFSFHLKITAPSHYSLPSPDLFKKLYLISYMNTSP